MSEYDGPIDFSLKGYGYLECDLVGSLIKAFGNGQISRLVEDQLRSQDLIIEDLTVGFNQGSVIAYAYSENNGHTYIMGLNDKVVLHHDCSLCSYEFSENFAKDDYNKKCDECMKFVKMVQKSRD